MRLIDGKKCEDRGPTAIGLPFSIPIYMGKPSEPYGARLWGVCNTPLPCRSIVFIQMGRGATAYAPLDVPDKGTNAGARLFRRVICWGCPGPIIPDSGAYAIRPYPDGRLFSSKWVGAYCIRPIRRPRQGDVCGCEVGMSRPFLGLRRGRRGRDGSVFWTAEGWRLPIRQVF